MQAVMAMKFRDFTVRELSNGEVIFTAGAVSITLPRAEGRN
jgi:hypothetical protein